MQNTQEGEVIELFKSMTPAQKIIALAFFRKYSAPPNQGNASRPNK